METLPPAEGAVVRRLVAGPKTRPEPLTEILHAVRAALGFVPEEAVPAAAAGLNLWRVVVPASTRSAGA
jgi:hypothetical protein